MGKPERQPEGLPLGTVHSPIPPSTQHSVPALAFKGPPGLSSEKVLNGDFLYFIERDLFLSSVVEHGSAGGLVVGDVLGRAICFSGRITSPPRSVQQGSNSG